MPIVKSNTCLENNATCLAQQACADKLPGWTQKWIDRLGDLYMTCLIFKEITQQKYNPGGL